MSIGVPKMSIGVLKKGIIFINECVATGTGGNAGATYGEHYS